MKILSLILFTLFFAVNSVIAQNGIQGSIDQFVNDPALAHASVSFHIIDLKTGTTVASHTPELALPTASTAKLFSTATALNILTPNYRPETKVYGDGTLDSNGVYHGNLWIKGGGDPSIGSKYFTEEGHASDFFDTWINELKKKGITKISGSIIGDASAFGYNGAPDGWNWVDLGNYYGAGPSGLSIYDNMVRYRFSVPSTTGRKVKLNSMKPNVPELNFHNYIVSSKRKGDNAYLYGAPYSLDRFGTGTLPIGSNNFLVKGSLPDPEFQFAHEFHTALNEAGIQVLEPAKSKRKDASMQVDYSECTLFITHKGERLIDVINYTNLRSVNLFAEHMISLIGYKKTGNGSTESGLNALESYWKDKFNTSGMYINDGSGLSRMNAISAKHFTGMLKYMDQSSYATEFRNSLPVAGTSGTLKYVCRGQSAQNRMFAKSGSMTRIKSYAGYIDSKNGKRYAFALIVNNYTCSSSALRKKMELVFNKIALN